MIDAEEAEARARATAESGDMQLNDDVRAGVARTVLPAETQAHREASEREQMHLETERRRVAKARNRVVPFESAIDGTGEEALTRPAGRETDVSPGSIEEVGAARSGVDAKQEARTVQELAQADKRAAKDAARRMAALEKKEARERRALAKAAARRRN